jgi:hypothetical protein
MPSSPQRRAREADEPPDHVGPLFLSLSFASFLVFAVLYRFRDGGIVEAEEFRLYALCWLTVPLATIIVTAVLRRFAGAFFRRSSPGLLLLLVAHAVFWWKLVTLMKTLFPGGTIPHDRDDLGPPLARYLLLYAVGNVALGAIFALGGRLSRLPRVAPWFVLGWRTVLDPAIPLVLCAVALPFLPRTLPPWTPWVVSLLFGVATPLVFPGNSGRSAGEPSSREGRLHRWSYHLLILLLIALIVADPMPDVEMESHNFYLGPVASILGGRTPLVDVNCQYGVGVLYFIAAAIKLHLIAPSYVGLGKLLSVLFVLHYWLLYWLLLVLTRSLRVAAGAAFLVIVVCYYGQESYQIAYPSTGPLRFGLGYLFLASLALRARYPQHRRWAIAVECLAIGGASIWSVESFMYVMVAYLAMLLFQALQLPSLRASLIATARRMVPAVAAIAGAHLALTVNTWIRAGQLPHWRRYTDFLLVYTTQEFGTMLVSTWTPWVFVVGVYLLSVLALGYRRFALGIRDPSPDLSILIAATGMGVAQFTYFLGRSHPTNLFHVSTPAIVVAFGWVAFVLADRQGSSRAFRGAVAYFTVVSAAFLGMTCVPDVLRKYDHSLLSFAVSPRDVPAAVEDARAREAADLIRRYAVTSRVALFSAPDVEVAAFLSSGTSNVWPVSYGTQDALVPAAVARAKHFAPPLHDGDIVFLDVGGSPKDQGMPLDEIDEHPALSGNVSGLERGLFDELASHFSFRIVEHQRSGIVAVRLVARR